MKKSNIALIFLFAGVFGLLGYTKAALTKKFRNGEFRKTVTIERVIPIKKANEGDIILPAFRHVVFSDHYVGSIEMLNVKDSSLTDVNGRSVGLIKYRQTDNSKFLPAQFHVSGDTLFMSLKFIEAATIYATGLRSVKSLPSGWNRPIQLNSIHADNISLIAGANAKITLSDCSFKSLNARINLMGSINCASNNLIDTVSFVLANEGVLRLENFKGVLNNIYTEPMGNLQLVGGTFETLIQHKTEK